MLEHALTLLPTPAVTISQTHQAFREETVGCVDEDVVAAEARKDTQNATETATDRFSARC